MTNACHEYKGGIHLHTTASDGAASHQEVARLAAQAGLDFLIVTDHNVLTSGVDGWYDDVLLLVGEEIHDTTRLPEANHYLAFDIQSHVPAEGASPQQVIDEVNSRGGFGFIAHPFEHSPPLTGEPELPWVDWEVIGYAGLEIWNYMSEFKSYLRSVAGALFFILCPRTAIAGPFPETLAKWDELLSRRKTAAIAGTDAHSATYSIGPLRRAVLPYEDCLRAVRTHILTPEPLTGALDHDRRMVYQALREGKSFVAYDAIGDATGFSFQARSGESVAGMGEDLRLSGEVTFKVSSPLQAELRLSWNGQTVAQRKGTGLRHTSGESGVYRVEARRTHLWKSRGWVFTNPVYVVD
ncbi:MAG TPA: CehA/McbA family metallohydrolase [Anaerolineae bacterium]|nr:CehA/McbA family metallohydrolase [Anaerolineae bacterium]